MRYVYEGGSFDMETTLFSLPKEKFPVSLDNFILKAESNQLFTSFAEVPD